MSDLLKVKNQYIQLRHELDSEIQRLAQLHNKHLACKKGCDLCCLNFSVFPLEFEIIREALQGSYDPNPATDIDSEKPASCLFLENHACSIYDHRPFICRTHGLPLLYMNEEDWVLSHCELNFTEAPEDYFDEENTFAQDTWNSRLYLLNREYLKHENKLMLQETDLIPLAYINLKK
jgi:uncharacterized protein